MTGVGCWGEEHGIYCRASLFLKNKDRVPSQYFVGNILESLLKRGSVFYRKGVIFHRIKTVGCYSKGLSLFTPADPRWKFQLGFFFVVLCVFCGLV